MRVFGTIRATLKTGDKGVTVFHNLDADAISEVYISDSAPASAVFTKHEPPPPAQIFGLGGGCRLVLAGLKTAVKRDAVLCERETCRKIFVFQHTSRLRVSITTQLLTPNMMGVLV